ncbi:MAG: DUF87 domain-containing protein [Thermoanaerobaculia bacterium]
MQEYEKLGLFYLGREIDAESAKRGDEPLLYDARDLVTHATIIGMTGSGKTGLGIALLEEAAIDGVPAVVIDPKGDLADLALSFPNLSPEEFRPWVRKEDAARKGVSFDELVAQEAAKWKKGLADWGQDGARVARYREAARVALFTPGSDVGRPISILASFAPPPPAILEDGELLGDRIETTVTSLLGLLGIEADPMRSREHILLANLFQAAWKAGRSYDLAGLIGDLQKPPIEKVGVIELETFYPARDRFELAMRVNNLLAAPGFEVWTRGEALSLDRLLYDGDGRPRLAVVSIAHLSESERMFFVSLLLNEAVAWMRAQSGTSSLRALLYMDEMFGYLPPVADPPSKKPLLTLLKQARAFGFGVVLSTQNPVDLDYKALGNIGTWALGRLSTERDKARVLDGLEGVAGGGGLDRAAMDRMLSALAPRRFLLRNVHEEAPLLFETRWVLSYMAGPLEREQLRRLAADQSPPLGATKAEVGPTDVAANVGTAAAPVLSPEIPQVFAPPAGTGTVAVYRPALLGIGRVHLENPRAGVAEVVDVVRVAEIGDSGLVDWSTAAEAGFVEEDLESAARAGARFAAVPERAQRKSSYTVWAKEFADDLYRGVRLEIWKAPEFDLSSNPGESERDFRVRLADGARRLRDEAVEAARRKAAPRLEALEQKIRRAESRVETERQQASSRGTETLISIGSTVLGALFGRRRLSATTLSRATSSVRSASRTMKEKQDVERAEEGVESLVSRRQELEEEIRSDLAAVAAKFDPATARLESVSIKPRKADVEVRRVVLVWIPEAAGS